MQNRGKTSWVSHIRSVLCCNGFEQVWLFGCGNDKIFFNELKERFTVLFAMDGRNTYNRVKGWKFIKVIRTALKGKSMRIFVGWTYTGMPFLSPEWVYPRLMSINTVFHQQRVMWLAHFVLKKKKQK